jgi:hypothetical protein
MYNMLRESKESQKNIYILPKLSYIRKLANELLNFIITDYCHGYDH